MVHRSPFPDVTIPRVSLIDYIFEHADRHPQTLALIDGETGRSLSYRELVHALRRTAAGLIARGVRKGDVCAIYSPNAPEYAVAFYAIVLAGGIATTVNPHYAFMELTHQLRDSGARFLVTTAQLLRTARRGARLAGITEVFTIDPAEGATALSALLAHAGRPPRIDIDPQRDVAVLPYSSGTTGLAKGVMLTHFNVVANLQQMSAVEQIGAGEMLIAAVPFYHIYGMVMVLSQGLRAGATIVTMSRFRAKLLLKTIENASPAPAPSGFIATCGRPTASLRPAR
jgi:acyl-CoA synthetase (AMP-forming)/AMP-acid ligase II